MKQKKLSRFDEYRTTTNNYVYNRLHKKYLEKKGKIRCSWCKYHKNENYEGKYYGEEFSLRNYEETIFRYPNWKLVSKKEKQWMDGTFEVEKYRNRYTGYVYEKFTF